MNKLSIILLSILILTPIISNLIKTSDNPWNSEIRREVEKLEEPYGSPAKNIVDKTRHKQISLMASSTQTYTGSASMYSEVPLELVNDSYQSIYWHEGSSGEIVGVFSNSTIVVYNSYGQLTYNTSLTESVGDGCVFEDFTNDGDIDFALIEYDTNADFIDIAIFDIDDQQITRTPIKLNYSFTSANLTGLDLDGDTEKELAIIARPQILFYDVTNGELSYINSTLVNFQVEGYFSADLNGDGVESLVLFGSNNSDYVIEELVFDGSNLLENHVIIARPDTTKPVFVVLGDFDGDGNDDILFTFLVNNTHMNATILTDLNQVYYTDIVKITSSPSVATIIDVFTYDIYSNYVDDVLYVYWLFPSTFYLAYLNVSTSNLVNLLDITNYLSFAVIDRNLDGVPELAIQENDTSGNWIEVYDSSISLTENFTVPSQDLTLIDGAEIDPFYGKFVYKYSSGYCILRDKASSARIDLTKPDTSKLQITKNGSIKASWQTTVSWKATNITVTVNNTVVWWNDTNFNYSISVNFTEEAIYDVSVNLYVVDIGVLTVFFYVDYDVTPPLINLIRPSNETYTNNSTITVFWDTRDNVKLGNVSIFLNGSLEIVSSNTTGSYNLTNLGEGIWNLTIFVMDLSGNNNSTTIIFFVDRTPPTIFVSNPSNNSYCGKNVIINYIALDRFGISRVEVYDNNTHVKDADPSSTSVSLYNLTDGLHKITLLVYDKAGNNNFTQIMIVVDTVPPIIGVDTENYSRVPSPFKLKFDIVEENLDFAKIYLNGTVWITYDSKNISNMVEINYPNGGWVNVTFVVYDLAGNRASLTLLLYVDINPPEISIINPVNWTVTNNVTVEVEWNSSYTDVVSVGIYLNGTFIDNVSYSDKKYIIDLQKGPNEILLESKDLAGNVFFIKVYVILDTDPPEITELNFHKFVNTTNVFLEVNTSDNVGVREIRIIYGDKTLIVLADSLTTEIILEEGNNTIDIMVIDIAGNVNVTSIWIFVDLNGPNLVVESPRNNTYTKNSTIKISFKYADTGSGVNNVKIVINGSLKYEGLYNTIIIYLDNDGTYLIKIIAIDKAGNKASCTLIVHRDTRPPTMVEIFPKNGSLVPKTKYIYLSIDDASPTLVNITTSNRLIVTNLKEKDINVSITFEEGVNVLNIEVIDLAGNKLVATLYYTSDQKPPILSIYPTSGDYFVGEEIYFKVNVSDDYGVLRVDVFVDGDYIGSLVEEKSSFKLAFSKVGTHRITFVGIDLVGNEASYVVIINVVESPQNAIDAIVNTSIPIILFISALIGLLYGYFRRR